MDQLKVNEEKVDMTFDGKLPQWKSQRRCQQLNNIIININNTNNIITTITTIPIIMYSDLPNCDSILFNLPSHGVK